MGRQTRDAVVVTRYHRAESASCEEAIRLLLDFAEKEKKGGSSNRPDDAMKGFKSDRARNIIQN